MSRVIVFIFVFYALVKTLKRNLLVKRLIQGQQKSSISIRSEQLQQHNNKLIDAVLPTPIKQNNQSCNEDNNDNQKQKQKQELLERNRYYINYINVLSLLHTCIIILLH